MVAVGWSRCGGGERLAVRGRREAVSESYNTVTEKLGGRAKNRVSPQDEGDTKEDDEGGETTSREVAARELPEWSLREGVEDVECRAL